MTANDYSTKTLLSRLFAAKDEEFCGMIIFKMGFSKQQKQTK
jgi:hypothetical protein